MLELYGCVKGMLVCISYLVRFVGLEDAIIHSLGVAVLALRLKGNNGAPSFEAVQLWNFSPVKGFQLGENPLSRIRMKFRREQ